MNSQKINNYWLCKCFFQRNVGNNLAKKIDGEILPPIDSKNKLLF